MKILITGAQGQLGRELQRSVPDSVEIIPLKREELDISDAMMVRHTITSFKPQVIINAAAYTAVDKAEDESDTAYAINADGPANLANIALDQGIRLLHISTDFVFDGKQSSPYRSKDTPNPSGVYGESKHEGEQNVLNALGDKCVIIRTAWVYSAFGNNFVKTMLRLMKERDHVDVVCDQIGTPTWAGGLAEALWKIAQKNITGIYHWTDAGVASWYDFAVAIQEEALNIGLLEKAVPINPITTKDYPTAAPRPAYSVLDKSSLWKELGAAAPHWRENLRKMLRDLK
ncbi:MAG: dTDP-4-dehydrorhamnose reductase [Proteobacteria bacterium]|nr:dTDP-4-dehydrorhamnose reductase [Pseudomonadota bacterium]MBU1708646.1 dTDP-4-dehydrorhamnose reductase [Pseudomonadota bacterium]